MPFTTLVPHHLSVLQFIKKHQTDPSSSNNRHQANDDAVSRSQAPKSRRWMDWRMQGGFPSKPSAANRSHGVAVEACAAWNGIATVFAAGIAWRTTRVRPTAIEAAATRDCVAAILALSAARRAKGVWPAAEEPGTAWAAITTVLRLPRATFVEVLRRRGVFRWTG
ncbi:hypothetical protein EsDP_00004536 [Epichloe bromicola]|uniref:Uncharacterized protein n=1 Tax=Epichloe bromicola TaxID=79588 RepID=A0ABQ0CS25_9HYPO